MNHRWFARWNTYALTTILALAGLCATPAQAIEVLLLWDDSYDAPDNVPITPAPPLLTSLNLQTRDFVAALEAAGISVTLSDTTQYNYNGTNPLPAPFDVIVHLNGNIVVDEAFEPLAGFFQVESYIKAGGGYIGCENNGVQVQAGASLDEFTPIEYVVAQGPNDGQLDISFPAAHPIFTGLTSPFTIDGTFVATQLRDYTPSPDLATELATDEEGNTAVAVRELGTGNGRIVGFHHRGNYKGPGQRSTTLSDANVRTLYINAIRWADQTPPKVTSVDIDGPPVSNAATAAFLVNFSEAVSGVDASDFVLSANALGVTASPVFVVSEISPRQYRVEVSGVSGGGLLGIDLVDDDSIVDESSNVNSLAKTNNADGSYVSTGSDLINVDRIAPSVQAITTVPDPAITGSIPLLRVEFDEPMKNSVAPVITLTTAANGTINLASGGSWFDTLTYQVALGRVLTNADAGPVTLNIATAQDFIGNSMNAFAGTPLTFEPIGLTASVSPTGLQERTVGDSITFEVSLIGLTGDAHYDWKKDTDTKEVTSVGSDSPILTLTNLAFTDSGTYYCLVTDDVAVTQTPQVQLSVVAALPLGGASLLAALSALAALGGATLRRRR